MTSLISWQSLISPDAFQVANAKVLDVLRQMNTFELSMMRLDIRQVGGGVTSSIGVCNVDLGGVAEPSQLM